MLNAGDTSVQQTINEGNERRTCFTTDFIDPPQSTVPHKKIPSVLACNVVTLVFMPITEDVSWIATVSTMK